MRVIDNLTLIGFFLPASDSRLNLTLIIIILKILIGRMFSLENEDGDLMSGQQMLWEEHSVGKV